MKIIFPSKQIFPTIFLLLVLFICVGGVNAQDPSSQFDKIFTLSMNNGFVAAYKEVEASRMEAIKNGNKFQEIVFLSAKSIVYSNDYQLDMALKVSDTAMLLAQKYNYKLGMAYALYSKAYAQQFTNEIIEVIKNGQEVQRLLQGTNQYTLLSRTSTLLFIVYLNWGDKAKSEEYVKAGYQYAQLSKNPAQIYKAKVNEFIFQLEFVNAKDTAENIKLYKKSDALAQEYLSDTINNTKLSYLTILVDQTSFLFKNYEKLPLQVYIKRVKDKVAIANELLKNDKVYTDYFEATLLIIQANVAELEEKNIPKSIEFVKLAIKEFDRSKINPNYAKAAYLSQYVSDYYEGRSEYKEALAYRKTAAGYNAKLFDKEKVLMAQRIELDNQAMQKNLKIKNLTLKNKNDRDFYLFVLVTSLILILGLVFLIRSYKYRLKFAQVSSAKSKLEREEALLSAKLADEERQRIKAEKELLDYKQEQLTKTVLTSKLQLDHKNVILGNIKDQLKIGDKANIQKLLKEEEFIDSDFEETQRQIQEVHPNFFPHLLEIAQQKLTPLDLKFSAYLHLNMDTKQIAKILNIEPKSVRMSKYRLKQKLGLPKDVDLDSYIKELN